MGRAFEYRKAKKFKRWGNMSRMFTRIGKEITMAVKEGGPSPDSNSRLRAAIQNAKAENMPKENVERAIKKATAKDTADYKEVVFEGYAPHGVAVLIECATDNNTRTVANIRSYFNKYNGSLGTTGMLDFIFDHKCRFTIKNNPNIDELELIDAGVEEYFEEEENLTLFAPFSDFGSIQKYLESKEFEIVNSGFERIPNNLKDVTTEQAVEIEKLIERIEEDEDVQTVYTNINIV